MGIGIDNNININIKKVTKKIPNHNIFYKGAFMEEDRGFFYYEVKNGDTIYKIVNRFGSTVEQVITANPGIRVYNLRIGQSIIIPVGEIVETNVNYDYSILRRDIKNLKLIYPFLEIGEIGRSVLGKPIQYIKIGRGNKEVFYNASFHANEWINSPVVMKFLEHYARAFVNNQNIFGYNAKSLFYNTTLYVVPMVNPDGVDLVTGSMQNVDIAYQNAQEIANNFPNIPFPSGWKANIEGIDLNLQFPAGWEQARKIKYAQGFNKPAPRDFVGYQPLIAPEAIAVYNFTLKRNFRLVIAYHTQGREIYWNFQNYNPPRGEYIGKRFSEVSGYALEEVPYNSSFAGYKDWFIQNYNRPGYTIESGLGQNPLPISQFDEIYRNNLGILVLGLVL